MKRLTPSTGSLVQSPVASNVSSLPVDLAGWIRTLTVGASGLAFGAFSAAAFALGLGDIRAESYLGQPLQARVELVNVNSDLNRDNLFVRLVGVPESKALGAEVFYGTHVVTATVVEDRGRLVVELATRAPVREPYLSLLLELRWPSGSVYREYPVLLDPPELVSAPSVATGTSNQAPAARAASALPPVRTGAAAASNKAWQALPVAEGKYTVQPGDSLSRISARWVEGSSQSIQNANEWILANNPRAFINQDMNRLIAGAKLAMPDLASLQNSQSTPTAEATGQTSRPPSDAVAAAVTPNIPSSEATAAPGTDALSRGQDIGGLMTVSDSADDKTRELIDMLARENENLRARMQKLESSEYLTTMRELVQLQQEQIQQLQSQLGTEQEIAAEVEAMYERLDLAEPVVAGQPSDTNAPTRSAQELLQQLNNSAAGADTARPNAEALVELEPQGTEAFVNETPHRGRLILLLLIAGGVLAAVLGAMWVYYRKMVPAAAPLRDAQELPGGLRRGHVVVPHRGASRTAELNKDKAPIAYDGAADQGIATGEETEAWYGEKVKPFEQGADQHAQDLTHDFSSFELDDDFLNAARADVAEASLEAMTQELPNTPAPAQTPAKPAAPEQAKKPGPRRSDEEVRTAIAEKMSQYDSEGGRDDDMLASLELEELDHMDDATYDEVETVVYRAMMYCEFKKFDKARHLIEVKMATDDDQRLVEALAQVQALQAETEQRNAAG